MQCISLWSKYATNLRYLGLDKQSLFARPVIAIDWSIPSQLMACPESSAKRQGQVVWC